MEQIPNYKRIQDDILEAIATGRFRAGQKLPTEMEMTQQYGVSRITVQRALTELKLSGHIFRKARAGTFVAIPPQPDVVSPTFWPRRREAGERIRIGIIAPFDLRNTSAYQYLSGIMKALANTEHSITLQNTQDVEQSDRVMLRNCMADRCDGIIYYPGVEQSPPIDYLIEMETGGYPCVLIDKTLPCVHLPSVQPDNVGGMRAMTRHLLGKGHSRIAFVSDRGIIALNERYVGFCREMASAGLVLTQQSFYHLGVHDSFDAEAALPQWLQSGVTAICCASDLHASMVLEGARSMGISVPQQLAITGFDGALPEITSMAQPYEKIGECATRLLLGWINDGQVSYAVTSLPTELKEGITG